MTDDRLTLMLLRNVRDSNEPTVGHWLTPGECLPEYPDDVAWPRLGELIDEGKVRGQRMAGGAGEVRGLTPAGREVLKALEAERGR